MRFIFQSRISEKILCQYHQIDGGIIGKVFREALPRLGGRGSSSKIIIRLQTIICAAQTIVALAVKVATGRLACFLFIIVVERFFFIVVLGGRKRFARQIVSRRQISIPARLHRAKYSEIAFLKRSYSRKCLSIIGKFETAS
jgi:hypothetical protein